MKRWRKIVIFTMLLALSFSMWASITMASHCQTSEDTSHVKHMNDDAHEHMHDQAPAHDDDSSDHSNCDCGCSGSLDCSMSGCSASILTTTIKFDLRHLTASTFQQIRARAEPSDPSLLFRPPIFTS